MTRRRWIADEVSGDRAALTGEHARHLSQVLRAQVGQEFDISTGAEIRRGRIATITPDRVEFDLGELVSQIVSTPITVATSIFKFDRMEWAIEKCTELGVARIIPVISARTETHLASAAGKRIDRWNRIAKQASEQSRRIAPPEICPPVTLKDLLKQSAELRVVLSEAEETLQLKDAIPQSTNSLLLAFGPEGGWKQDELAAFNSAGWISASLGSTILRTETAIIAAVAIATAMLPKEPTTNHSN
jgi:16S rRNA (uracil1498-N3)-methyltransferase